MKQLSNKQNYNINVMILKMLLVPFIGSLLIVLFGLIEIILYTRGL